MYQVLLADDEESVLEILRTSIDWQGLGIENIYTVSDGQEALELMEQYQIDLLITDIRMPRVDGIELIRRVRELYRDIHCILLTAYGEFSYAKEAINLGVENYLLKPVAKEEVEQTIRSALDNLYRKRHSSAGMLMENVLRRWSNGTISGEELSERAAVLGINLYLPQYCVICVSKKTKHSISMFQTDLSVVLNKEYEVYHFWDEKGRFTIILGGKKIHAKIIENQVRELMKQDEVEEHVIVSIGTPVEETDLLHISSLMATETLEQTDITSDLHILQADQDNSGLDNDLLVEEIRTLFFDANEIYRDTGYQHIALKLYKFGTDSSIQKLMKSSIKVMITEFPEQENLQNQIYEIEWNINTLDKQIFLECVVSALKEIYLLFDSYMKQRSPIVQAALCYIHNSVLTGNGVSVKEFCAKNGMNPAYLGHIFKKETGSFFNDYLTQCRINQSVILLRNPGRKVKDIAESIGFTSTSYYVKCFREAKGSSPAKYRLMISGQNSEE